ELDQRPADDPERTFVMFMCAYAGDILAGVLPGPYNDRDARRYGVAPSSARDPTLSVCRRYADR
ncbi:MAG TPA: hypothetical protein VES36_05420, partial [Candidatus Limnocylindrales bacterium]|nr:hypothetical protein [Candidatus Limnocylindrales bacterium]